MTLVMLTSGACDGTVAVERLPTQAFAPTSVPSQAATFTSIPATAAAPPPTMEPTASLPPTRTAVPAPLATPLRAPTPTATAVPTAAPPAGTSGERALRTVRYLAETIGSRPAGSPQERASAGYIAEQ
ncbi:MAG: hypothetical protein Q7R39_16680, partial [Dehalococcoidia bacterium]|nr:hypothetical protein [Dehalococcoidia bacterium]